MLCDRCQNREAVVHISTIVHAGSPAHEEHLCPECAEHFSRLKKYLGILGLPFEVNHRLVRGLDYYSKTVFEIHPPEEASQSALGGGGRYDSLIQAIGGKPAPAIGFGTGIERIVLNLKKQEISMGTEHCPVPPIRYSSLPPRNSGDSPCSPITT